MNKLSYLRACVMLIRPLNCAITAASAGVGALTAAPWPFPGQVGAAALAAALITGAGNAFNDLVDVDIDLINRPSRPLPAGRISPAAALATAGGLAVCGVTLAWLVSRMHALVAAVVLAMLALYSLRLKRTAFWGNLAVAAMAATVFPFGATAAGSLGRSWIPASLAFLFHLGREVIKDIEDFRGDSAVHAETVPVRLGTEPARRLAAFLVLAVAGLALLPAALDVYGVAYLLPVLGLDLLLLITFRRLQRPAGTMPQSQLGILLKAGMLLGLAAVVAGELTR